MRQAIVSSLLPSRSRSNELFSIAKKILKNVGVEKTVDEVYFSEAM